MYKQFFVHSSVQYMQDAVVGCVKYLPLNGAYLWSDTSAHSQLIIFMTRKKKGIFFLQQKKLTSDQVQKPCEKEISQELNDEDTVLISTILRAQGTRCKLYKHPRLYYSCSYNLQDVYR